MKKLIKKKKNLLNCIMDCEDMIKGSISSVCSNCQRARCICKNKSGKILYRLTYKDKDQKTKTVYVHKTKLNEIKNRIACFNKAKKILDELVENNIAIFKASQSEKAEK
jgi:hypothetical protein